MAYIVLSLIGLLAITLVRSIWKMSIQILFILSTIIVGFMVFIAFDISLPTEGIIVRKGSAVSQALEYLFQIPWFEISLYFVMLLGMAAKYFYDAIGEASAPNFQKWQLFKPMLVSPLVFGAIYGNMGEHTPKLLLLIFSFQNGFFWKTVLDKTPHGRTTHAIGTEPLSQPPPQSSAT